MTTPSPDRFTSSNYDILSASVSVALNGTPSSQPVTPRLPNEGVDEQEEEEGYYFEAAELGIPFALTAAIIIVLCITVIYTKMRRGRLRRHQAATSRAHNIHGLPISLQNRGLPDDTVDVFDGGNSPPSYDSSVYHNVPPQPPQYFAVQCLPRDSPPKYEDILKNTSASNADQGVQTTDIDNPGFTLSEESTQTTQPASTSASTATAAGTSTTQSSCDVTSSAASPQ